MRTRLLLTIIAALPLATACSSLRPDGWGSEIKHDSGLLVDGHDSRGQLREDSLDVWNTYLYWQRSTRDGGEVYAEIGAGLKLREGGFYLNGPPVVADVRFGRRFRFQREYQVQGRP